MIELAQLLSIIWFISSVLEKDTGRAISAHMVFNEKLFAVMVYAWMIVGFINLVF
jgi:hypothetical protein